MKIVHTTDWHPDASTAGYARFHDVEQAVQSSVDHACTLKSQGERVGYLFTGDLLTNDPSLDVMVRCTCLAQRAGRQLSESGIPSWWMAGNHDVFEDGLGTTAVDTLEGEYAYVIKSPMALMIEPGKLMLLLPFTPMSHSYDPKAWVESVVPGAQMVFYDPKAPLEAVAQEAQVVLVAGHLMLEGIGPGSETTDMPRGRDVFFPIDLVRKRWPNALMANGHYHRQQVYNGVHIPGSLAVLTRGELGNRPGYLVYTV